ncbi:nuclear transport factor 2 family protein [Haliea sp. E1-2-M8]|uniref:nuclear transport factor 2 family protein n=1 Tax=Haliea sp. E1-2-M8 TaxID=3064706 RepID=UPI0027272390|nr:nuclear transport factor 2 family protein [Haliea sp. E1-2-M8]MDO8862923.1 nuclear transport factor 2 family protein [Haliea sp. E1-2-M8]
MTDSSKDIVRRFLSAAQQGDMATVASLLHPEAKVIEADSLPFGGVVSGFEGFTRLVRRVFTTFANTAVTVDEYIADGDTVVVLATMTGQSKVSGEAFSMPISEIWRLREGLITEIKPFYHDTQKINALAAGTVASG